MDKIVDISTEISGKQKDIKSSLSMIKVVIDGIKNFGSNDTIKDVSESVSSLETMVN